MKASTIVIKVALLLLGALVTTSCQSSQQARSQALVPKHGNDGMDSLASDYTKPYLTDDKMQRFITSMKEEHNPLELMFKPGGQVQNPANLNERIEEFNSFARKYGFLDYQDYMGVWGRITAGEMQSFGEQSFRSMISGAQAELKKPDLAPEMRKVYEDQITTAQKSLDDMNKQSSSVNAADMELINKYKDQIDAAEKKYQAAK